MFFFVYVSHNKIHITKVDAWCFTGSIKTWKICKLTLKNVLQNYNHYNISMKL